MKTSILLAILVASLVAIACAEDSFFAKGNPAPPPIHSVSLHLDSISRNNKGSVALSMRLHYDSVLIVSRRTLKGSRLTGEVEILESIVFRHDTIDFRYLPDNDYLFKVKIDGLAPATDYSFEYKVSFVWGDGYQHVAITTTIRTS